MSSGINDRHSFGRVSTINEMHGTHLMSAQDTTLLEGLSIDDVSLYS